MRKTYLVAALAACVGAGPAGAQDINEQVPSDPVTVRGDYVKLASCIYRRLDDDMRPAIKKIDLTNEMRLIVDNSRYKMWQLTLTPAQPGYTLVNFSRGQTALGPMRVPEVMQAVQACAAQ